MPRAPAGPVRSVTVAQMRSLLERRDAGFFQVALGNAQRNKQKSFIFVTSNGRRFLVQLKIERAESREVGPYDGHGGSAPPSRYWLDEQEKEYKGSGSYFSLNNISRFVRKASPYAMGAAEMMAPELIPAIEGATEAAEMYNQFTGRGAFASGRPTRGFIETLLSDIRQGIPCYFMDTVRVNRMRALGIRFTVRSIYAYCTRIENEGDLEEVVFDPDKYVFDSRHNVRIHALKLLHGDEMEDGYETEEYIPYGNR